MSRPIRVSQQSIPESIAESSLASIRDEARDCRACPLWEISTQTVFGEGSANASIMLVGEAPGEQEDRHGAPFVGAAGQLLTELLSQAELDRSALYVTNAVKHRPSSPAGRGRQNRAPRQSETRACLPWLETEIRIIQPRVIVCLGAVAAKVILGKDFRLTKQRGSWHATLFAPQTMATLHPSYLLRQVTPETAAMTRQQVIADLREAGRRGREDRSQPAVAPEQ